MEPDSCSVCLELMAAWECGAGKHVAQLVMVMSAYHDALLQDCRQPFVSIRDPSTRMSLCEYHLEDKRHMLASKKAVVMCRVYRALRTGTWEVQAVGEALDNGDTRNYAPLLAWIAGQQWQMAAP